MARKRPAPKARLVRVRGVAYTVDVKPSDVALAKRHAGADDRDLYVSFAALRRTNRYHGTFDQFTAAVDVTEQG